MSPTQTPTPRSGRIGFGRRSASLRSPSTSEPRPAPEQPTTEDSEARLSRRFVDLVESGWSVPGFVLRRPRVALEVVRDLRSLPKLTADLPSGAEAEAVRSQLMRQRTSRRWMGGVSAVLPVPSVPGTYLDGHDRATVRRKIRAAAKRGVVVRPVRPEERPALLVLADRHERDNEREQYRTAQPENEDLLEYDLWIAAFDADGEPIALAVTPITGEWATLRYFRTLRDGQSASDARYVMTQVVAEELCARGVRHLVDTARPHWLPSGLRHFQRMVGFRLVRVSAARVLD